MKISQVTTIEVSPPKFPCYRSRYIGDDGSQIIKFIGEYEAIVITKHNEYDFQIKRLIYTPTYNAMQSVFCFVEDCEDLLLGEGRWDVDSEERFENYLKIIRILTV